MFRRLLQRGRGCRSHFSAWVETNAEGAEAPVRNTPSDAQQAAPSPASAHQSGSDDESAVEAQAPTSEMLSLAVAKVQQVRAQAAFHRHEYTRADADSGCAVLSAAFWTVALFASIAVPCLIIVAVAEYYKQTRFAIQDSPFEWASGPVW